MLPLPLLLKLRNALYIHGPRFNFDTNFTLPQLKANLMNTPPLGMSTTLISNIMNNLLNQLSEAAQYVNTPQRPLLHLLGIIKQQEIQVKLDSLFTHLVKALVEIRYKDASHPLAKDIEQIDVRFENNAPNIKAEAIMFLIECVCAVGGKSKQKMEVVPSQAPANDAEKKSQSKDKYQDFVRKFYAHENPKFIGEYEEKKNTFRVISFKEDRSAVYAVNLKDGKLSPLDSLGDVSSLVKKYKDSENYQTRELIKNLYQLISLGHLNFEPELKGQVEQIKTQEIPLYKIVELVLEGQKVFTQYQDQIWGSRWKDDSQVQFPVRLQLAKTPKEVVELMLYFWDNHGKVENFYLPDNEPTKRFYNRKHSVEEIRKMDGHKIKSVTINPLGKVAFCRTLLEQQKDSPNIDMTIVFLCAHLIFRQLQKYSKAAAERINTFRRKYQEAIEEEPSRASLRLTRRSTLNEKKPQKSRNSRPCSKDSKRVLRTVSYSGWIDDDQSSRQPALEKNPTKKTLRSYFESKENSATEHEQVDFDAYCYKGSKKPNGRDFYDV